MLGPGAAVGPMRPAGRGPGMGHWLTASDGCSEIMHAAECRSSAFVATFGDPSHCLVAPTHLSQSRLAQEGAITLPVFVQATGHLTTPAAPALVAVGSRDTTPSGRRRQRRQHNADRAGFPGRHCGDPPEVRGGDRGEPCMSCRWDAPLAATPAQRAIMTHTSHAPPCRRVTMPRTVRVAPLRTSSRPQQLQSQFLAPVAGLKGLCATFASEQQGNVWQRGWPRQRRPGGGRL